MSRALENFPQQGFAAPQTGTIEHNLDATEASFVSLRSELDLLKNENLQLLQENLRLNQQISRTGIPNNPSMLKYQQPVPIVQEGRSEDLHAAPISIPPDQSETDEKFFFPQSDIYGIEAQFAKQRRASQAKENNTDGISKLQNVSSSTGSDITSHQALKKARMMFANTDVLDNSSTSSESKISAQWEKLNDDSSKESKGNNLIQQSLLKKKLPTLILALLKYDDPDFSSDSDTFQDLQRWNYNVIIRLVELFFEKNNYYGTFISQLKVFEFLKAYPNLKDKEWEYDDDLVLLYLILILSVQKLTPKEFLDLELLPASSSKNIRKFRNYLSKNILYNSFEKLRHNLINESLLTIQAYILCTEWLFLEHKFEECWSMMFHTCSIAYSIGLHVIGQVKRTPSLSIPERMSADKINESDETDNEEDDDRRKIWFALKNLTAQICSVLGRPNPISIQVNGQISELGNQKLSDKINYTTLKIGLSECLRLSNLMLIENFMIDFTIEEVLPLEEKFREEIAKLELVLNDDILRTNKTQGESEWNKVDQTNLLMDLITLYINRAKLLEPFLKKFEDQEKHNIIIERFVNSILQSFELLNYFVEIFLNQFFEKNTIPPRKRSSGNILAPKDEKIENQSSQQDVNSLIKFERVFRVYFPFLTSFIYQGIIVIFTFLHCKFKLFVNNNPSSLLNNELLKHIEINLNTLTNFDSRISTRLNCISKLWSANIRYLIDRVLIYIKMIYERQEDKFLQLSEKKRRRVLQNNLLSGDQDTNLKVFDFNTGRQSEQPLENTENPLESPELEYLYGFQFNDPFWLTNPENLPYYLSSPSDDDKYNNKLTPTKRSQPSTDSAISYGVGSMTVEPSLAKPISSQMPVPIHGDGMYSAPNLSTQQQNYGNLWPNSSAPLISQNVIQILQSQGQSFTVGFNQQLSLLFNQPTFGSHNSVYSGSTAGHIPSQQVSGQNPQVQLAHQQVIHPPIADPQIQEYRIQDQHQEPVQSRNPFRNTLRNMGSSGSDDSS